MAPPAIAPSSSVGLAAVSRSFDAPSASASACHSVPEKYCGCSGDADEKEAAEAPAEPIDVSLRTEGRLGGVRLLGWWGCEPPLPLPSTVASLAVTLSADPFADMPPAPIAAPTRGSVTPSPTAQLTVTPLLGVAAEGVVVGP